MSKAQWTSLLTITQALGTSGTELNLAVADLDLPVITQTVNALGLQSDWAALRTRLNDVKFSSLSLRHGVLTVLSQGSTQKSNASGLSIQTEPELSLSVDPASGLVIKGLSLAAASGKATTLDGVSFNGDNTIDWHGSELEVQHTPLTFLSRELVGLTPSVVGSGRVKPALKDLIPLLVPLTEWIDAGGERSIDLHKAQIDAVAAELPTLVKDPDSRSQLQQLLSKIQSVQSTKASRGEHLLQVTSSDEIHCNINDQVEFVLSSQFGLGHVSRSDGADDTLVSLQVEGFQVTLPGPLPLPVAISRLELSATKLFIRDLPIIGSIGIDLPALPTGDEPAAQPEANTPAPKIRCT